MVSVTRLDAGTATNIIPDRARLIGTVRTLRPALRDDIERRLRALVAGIAAAYGATAEISYRRNYPVTVNHEAQTIVAAEIARGVVGADRVDAKAPPVMGAEDFSYMLEARPGSFIFIGNGDTAGLHSANYDFNDEIIPIGCSYWVRLVEETLAA